MAARRTKQKQASRRDAESPERDDPSSQPLKSADAETDPSGELDIGEASVVDSDSDSDLDLDLDLDLDSDLDSDLGTELETGAGPESRRLAEKSKGHEAEEKGIARLDPLQVYMREVQRHPLLTREEETKLAKEYVETGDVQAAARLVTANLRLVVKLAYTYRRAYRNMMDLVQEGNIGLMQAVKRFDPNRGVKLSSYSAWWIRAYMLRFILNNKRLVKLGTTQAQRKLFFNLNKERDRLTSMGIEPSHEEIAKQLDVSTADVVEMDKRLARSDASMDAPIGDGDGRQTSRGELMPSDQSDPEELAERAELGGALREYLAQFRETLEGKEATIFDERLVAEDPKTLQQLGDGFGVSRERVRQLEARLTGRLREYLRENLGDAVDVIG